MRVCGNDGQWTGSNSTNCRGRIELLLISSIWKFCGHSYSEMVEEDKKSVLQPLTNINYFKTREVLQNPFAPKFSWSVLRLRAIQYIVLLGRGLETTSLE